VEFGGRFVDLSAIAQIFSRVLAIMAFAPEKTCMPCGKACPRGAN